VSHDVVHGAVVASAAYHLIAHVILRLLKNLVTGLNSSRI
jgi:hypothetical protein